MAVSHVTSIVASWERTEYADSGLAVTTRMATVSPVMERLIVKAAPVCSLSEIR
jgi:hypothetical protein